MTHRDRASRDAPRARRPVPGGAGGDVARVERAPAAGARPGDGAERGPRARPEASGRGSRQAGFSLVEMLIAMTVLTVVMGAALGVFRTEEDALREGLDRMEVLQNVRFGANAVEKDLKTTGSHVPKPQPKLVYADEDVVAFNADFVTNVDSDPQFAVYYDPDAPNAEVLALTQSRQITVPNGTFQYPDRDYTDDDGNDSPAETIVFYFRPDSSTDRGDDWALFRKVNDQEAQLVSRHLLRVGGTEPFLEYHKLEVPPTGDEEIDTVEPGELPLSHDEAVHGSSDDDTAIDSVRAVRLRVAATNGETGDEEEVRSISRMIRIPNMGVEKKRVCGAQPNTVANLSVTPEVVAGSPTVLVEWDASVDQDSGDEDIVRYLVWKRGASETDWGPPMVALPVSGSSYSYRDSQVIEDQEYDYAVAAQDCTPKLSPKATAGPVEAPEP